MDLKEFVPSNENLVVELKIKDKNVKNADGTDMTVTVLSPFSKEYRAIVKSLTDEKIKSKDKTSYADMENRLLAETTVDWNITWDGEKPKFDKKLAQTIYEDVFWIKALIQEAQVGLADFTIP